MSYEQIREEIDWQINGVEFAANPEAHVAQPRMLAYRVLTVLGMRLDLNTVNSLEDEIRQVLDDHAYFEEDVYSHTREYRIRDENDEWGDLSEGDWSEGPALLRPKRRAITRGLLLDSQTAEQAEVETLVSLFAEDVAELFPDDIDADSIAYGWLLYQIAVGTDVPEHLADDQVEDWMIGRVIKEIILAKAERQRLYSLVDLNK